MKLSKGIRWFHRWVSIVFVVIVAALFAAMAAGAEPPQWIFYLPLAPLFLLMATGLYMFFLPYVVKARGAKSD